MRRRLAVASLTAVVLGTIGLTQGFGLLAPKARAADLLHSRFTNRISGYIIQDLQTGLQGSVPNTAAAPAAGAAPLTPSIGTTGCSQTGGTNVRANQDCTNNTSPKYPGRGQAQNETAIAVNPTNANNVLAGQNDYRRGDGSCGADFSSDAGEHWGNVLLPIGFSVPGVDNSSAARHYWTSSGDPSVAFDSTGAAYYACGAFDRSFPTNDDAGCANPAGSCASGLFVFRSVDGGASWNFPGGSTTSGQVIATPGVASTTGAQFSLEDKQYMGIDAHTGSPYRDRIYLAWTHYTPCSASGTCETAAIYISYSSDHGATWSTPASVSGSSTALCQNALNPATPNACDNSSFAQPLAAANGDVYVVFTNYNNAVSGTDNHNDILAVKSTNGGATFGNPQLVSQYYDLPDCYTYTKDDPFRACVPTSPLSTLSVFRAANYPSAVADPNDPNKIYVTFGSYINPDSNPSNALHHGQCQPNGLSPLTFLNRFKGVGGAKACNNDILLSVTDDGGATWSAAASGPAAATVVSNESTGLANQWWQWAATNSSGTLAVSYYDRQYGDDSSTGANDITLAELDGSSFEHERVTSVSSPPATEFPDATNGHSVFLGDYSGLALSGSTAYPIWSDTRDAEFYQCPTAANALSLCRVTNGSVQGQDEDVFTTHGLNLP